MDHANIFKLDYTDSESYSYTQKPGSICLWKPLRTKNWNLLLYGASKKIPVILCHKDFAFDLGLQLSEATLR